MLFVFSGKMLKHAVRTALDLDRLPPEKRISVAGVTFRPRCSTNNTNQPKLSLRKINSLSWPSSKSSENLDSQVSYNLY